MQVPIHIWNEVAAEQAHQLSPVALGTMRLPSGADLAELVDRWARLLRNQSSNPRIRLATVGIYPVMHSQAALRAYLASDPARAGLRGSSRS